MNPALRQGIIATAQAIGANPLDLATVISYETAGTFDPTKRGPTTQWGQHRGLIQFGEPQARQHGVDWNDPINSQLGPDGAVARYLRSSGFEPGMGLLDLYSTINAGGPGRYNRSDANNGGAPGTVRDKVEQQMAEHRRKAALLMGESGQAVADDALRAVGRAPTAPQGGPQGQQTLSTGGTMQARQTSPQGLPSGPEQQGGIRGLLGDRDRMDRLAVAFNSMTLNPDPSLAGFLNNRANSRDEDRQRQEASAKQAELMQQTMGWLQANDASPEIMQAAAIGAIPLQDAVGMVLAQRNQGPADPINMSPGNTLFDPTTRQPIFTAPERDGSDPTGIREYEFYAQQEASAGREPMPYGEWDLERRRSGGVNVNVNTAAGDSFWGSPPSGEVWARNEAGAVETEIGPDGRQRPVSVKIDSEEGRAQQAARAATIIGAGQTLIRDTATAIRTLEESGSWAAGRGSVLSVLPETAARELENDIKSIRGNIAIDSLLKIKQSGAGLGAIPQAQLEALGGLLGSLDTSMSPQKLMDNLRDIQAQYQTIVEAEGGDPFELAIGRGWNPETGRIESAIPQTQPGQQQGQQQAPSITPEQIGSMGPRDIMAMDIENLTDAQMQAILKRMDELGL